MPKDIRNLLEDFKDEKIELSNDHQTKFTARLIEELNPKKNIFSVVVCGSFNCVVVRLVNYFLSYREH